VVRAGPVTYAPDVLEDMPAIARQLGELGSCGIQGLGWLWLAKRPELAGAGLVRLGLVRLGLVRLGRQRVGRGLLGAGDGTRRANGFVGSRKTPTARFRAQ
jgi:hypothetical protein